MSNQPAPISACCHAAFIAVNDDSKRYACIKCGKIADPKTDRYWCAWCGEWGDHQSGWCKHLQDFRNSDEEDEE